MVYSGLMYKVKVLAVCSGKYHTGTEAIISDIAARTASFQKDLTKASCCISMAATMMSVVRMIALVTKITLVSNTPLECSDEACNIKTAACWVNDYGFRN